MTEQSLIEWFTQLILDDERFVDFVKQSPCPECNAARAHAIKHEYETQTKTAWRRSSHLTRDLWLKHVSCFGHRFVDKLKIRFNTVPSHSNPWKTDGVEVVKWGYPSVEDEIDGWAIINAPTHGVSVTTHRGQSAILAPVMVAGLGSTDRDGKSTEYVCRHVAVAVETFDGIILLHDDESVLAVSVAISLAGGPCIDTKVYTTTNITHEPVVTYKQRTQCENCS